MLINHPLSPPLPSFRQKKKISYLLSFLCTSCLFALFIHQSDNLFTVQPLFFTITAIQETTIGTTSIMAVRAQFENSNEYVSCLNFLVLHCGFGGGGVEQRDDERD